MVSNIRVTLKDAGSTTAVAQSYATAMVVPDDAARTLIVKGQYDWQLQMVDGIWKVAHVKL
jgi:hypothetical protein